MSERLISEIRQLLPDNPFPSVRECADEDGAMAKYRVPDYEKCEDAIVSTYTAAVADERRKVAEWLNETCSNGNHNKIFAERERMYCTTCIEQGVYKLERGKDPWD